MKKTKNKIMEYEPFTPKFELLEKLPNKYKRALLSNYNDHYDNSEMTDIKFSQSIECKQFVYKETVDPFEKYKQFLDLFIHSIEYVFMDVNENIYTFVPIIIKLNQNFKHVYCSIRNLDLIVGCDSCDGETSCSFELMFSSTLESLFKYNLTEYERQQYEYQECWNEIQLLKYNCNITKGEVKIILNPKPKFVSFHDVIIQF